jgi:rhodanese-related sulfurtransferase
VAAPRAPKVVLGAEARTLVAAGALLIDVRTVDEFNELHLDGARNIPLAQLGAAAGSLPKDKPIIVYCAVGSRSAAAAGMLAGAGFDVRNLGAMENWNR